MARQNFERVTKLPTIGGFSKGVYVVRSKQTRLEYIEKTLPEDVVMSGLARAEIEILKQVSGHPGITKFIDAEIDDHSASIYMGYYELGSLGDLVDRTSETLDDEDFEPLEEGFIWHVFLQLASTVAYCHYGIGPRPTPRIPKPGWDTVLHRDIKLDNIFMTSVGTTCQYPRIVLGDFGIATMASGRSPAKHYMGTKGWLPPEAPYHGMGSDVWHVAAVIQCLLLLSGRPHRDVKVQDGTDDILGALVDKILDTEYPDRPTSIELIDMVEEAYQERIFLEQRKKADQEFQDAGDLVVDPEVD